MPTREAWIVFAGPVEPVVLGLEADEDACRRPTARDHDLFLLGEAEESG